MNRGKSAGRIRSALKQIRMGNDRPAAGPLARGLSETDWIRIASLRADPQVLRFLGLLESARIEYACSSDGWKTIVDVKRTDYDSARACYCASSQPSRRTRPSARKQQIARTTATIAFSIILGHVLILGVLAGVMNAASSLATEERSAIAAVVGVAVYYSATVLLMLLRQTRSRTTALSDAND
jgi:hypothetical protein